MKINNKLLGLIPGLAKKIADATNGYKTLSGLVLTGAGVGCLFVPGLQSAAADLLYTGVPLTVVGLAHKIQKYLIKKGENE